MDWDVPVEVRVEVTRGSRLKRREDGRIQYVSPWATPFNYGSVLGFPLAADGAAQDAVLLGPPCPRGARVWGRRVGVMELLDDGLSDPKWIVLPEGLALGAEDELVVERFFQRYARYKSLYARLRGRPGVELGELIWASAGL